MEHEVNDHLGKLGISERIILNWMGVCACVCGMHSSGLEHGKVMAFLNTVISLWIS